MRALFIQQDHMSPTGPIGEQFANRGFDIEEFEVVPASSYPDPNVDVVFPDPLAYDVIIPVGAIWGVYQSDTVQWIADELTLLRTAHDAGVPILGICFGGQALAAALGGSVALAPVGEIGWHDVVSDDTNLIAAGPWFEWHQDRWSPPAGATTVARTSLADQSFVLGRSLGLQFHPEVTPAILQGWFDVGGEQDLVDHGIDPAALMSQTRDLEPTASARSRLLVDRFLDQVATREWPSA